MILNLDAGPSEDADQFDRVPEREVREDVHGRALGHVGLGPEQRGRGKYLALVQKYLATHKKYLPTGGHPHRPPQRQDGGAEGQEERGREAEGKFEEAGG